MFTDRMLQKHRSPAGHGKALFFQLPELPTKRIAIMGKKITWEEMKRDYPDEWLLIVDFELDSSGRIVAGLLSGTQKKRMMHKALKNAGIPVKARELAKHLTFTEAKIIIELTNKAGSENEKTELTRKLQGIFDR